MRLTSMMVLTVLAGVQLFASSHREAPITALDQKADITDWYAFVDPAKPDHVVMILNVDPFLEPGNGPNYFPFDPGILYEMKIDNNHDGVPDVTFQFRFTSEIRAPGVFTGFAGGIAGIPPITALDGPGSEGLNLRQHYTVAMIKERHAGPHWQQYAVRDSRGECGSLAPCPVTTHCARKVSIGWGTISRCSLERWRISSLSIWERRSIPLNFRKTVGGGVLNQYIFDFDDHHNYRT